MTPPAGVPAVPPGLAKAAAGSGTAAPQSDPGAAHTVSLPNLAASGGQHAREGNTAILLERLTPGDGYVPPESGEDDAPYGWFQDRHVIGSQSRVGGGVYLGRKPREAIVVDVRAGGLLRQSLAAWLDDLLVEVESGLRGPQRPEALVRAVRRQLDTNLPHRLANLVQRTLPFDEAAVQAVARDLKLQPDQCVPLDAYLARKGGVCRHQVCFLGAALELLAADGWLAGRVSIVRKHVPGYFSHAWVRWTRARDNVVFVFDAAQDVFSPLLALDASGQQLYGRDAVRAAPRT